MAEKLSLGARTGRLICKVGRPPDRDSFVWSGRISILAWLVFHTFFAARLFSPLQWWKQVVRHRPWASGEKNVRRDFHARNTEQYFIVATLFAAALWYLPALRETPALSVMWPWVAALLLGESIVWVLYYLVIRSFVERDYALFDRAEYLVLLPVVIAQQIFLSAALVGLPPLEVLLRALGAIDADPAAAGRWLPIFGAAYLAIAIAILVSTHPGLPIRERKRARSLRERKGTVLAIIGAGDLVQRRLFPALERAGLLPANIHLFDIPDSAGASAVTPGHADSARSKAHAEERVRKIDVTDAQLIPYHACANEAELIARVVALGAPTIIASASPSHSTYLRALGSVSRLPFAVEKPLVIDPADLPDDSRSGMMRHGFVLSYYLQEKALPLLALAGPLTIDSRFVEIHASSPEWRDPKVQRLKLGSLQQLSLLIHEPADERRWTYMVENGGQYFETMIHLLMLAMRLLGSSPTTWGGLRREEWTERAPDRGGPSYLHWHFSSATTPSITLSCHKSSRRRDRGALLKFAHGYIVADFGDTPSAFLLMNQAVQASAQMRADYEGKYSVLVEKMLEFFSRDENGFIDDPRTDHLAIHMDAIRYLHRMKEDLASVHRMNDATEVADRVDEVTTEWTRLLALKAHCPSGTIQRAP